MIDLGTKVEGLTSACGGDSCEVTYRSLTSDVKNRRGRRCRKGDFCPVTRILRRASSQNSGPKTRISGPTEFEEHVAGGPR